MQFKKVQYFVIFLTFLFGCDNPKKPVLADSEKLNSWIYLSINANSTEYQLYKNEDSLFVKTKNATDSLKTYKILSSEKDSLFKWAEKLIDNKSEPTQFCTDYFGKLKIQISYSEQMTKQIIYTSICEWEKFDSASSKIYKLVSKLKGSK